MTKSIGAGLVILCLAFGSQAFADIIMTSAGLNATLKTMARLKQQIAAGPANKGAEALFKLGMESDGLAALMNDEIAAHGMQEKQLIELALKRTKDMGISIEYNREKRRFFYDAKAFELYVAQEPRGEYVADAKFKLLEKQFYQSSATDAESLVAAAASKKIFLADYPQFVNNAEVSLFLAIDYRDLYRHHREKQDRLNQDKYEALTRMQLRSTIDCYPGTEQAQVSEQLLLRFDEEVQAAANTPR